MSVAKEGGVTFKTTCRKKVTIEDGTNSKVEEISLPSELEKELK
jgi:hypothetical protein